MRYHIAITDTSDGQTAEADADYVTCSAGVCQHDSDIMQVHSIHLVEAQDQQRRLNITVSLLMRMAVVAGRELNVPDLSIILAKKILEEERLMMTPIRAG